MKNHALALAVVSACGLVPQAYSHELAYSKSEQIHVLVEGDATNWCKPEIAITMQRPVWDDQKPLNGLLSKLPFILGQECPSAKVSWKAVDAKGAVYATGVGTATQMGLATLTAAPAVVEASVAAPVAAETSAPAPVAAPVVAQAPAPVAAPVATPAPAQVAAPVVAEVPAPVVAAPVAQAPAAVAPPVVAQAPVPVAVPAPTPAPVVTPVSIEPAVVAPQAPKAAIAAAPTADFGRSLVVGNKNLMTITDGAGCKWLLSKTAMDSSDPSIAFASSPAMPCAASGYAEGEFDKVRWSIPNTYRGDSWNRAYVHPSGLMFGQSTASVVKGKSLSYLSPNADQALFELGEIPARSMKVYLAFDRSRYRVLTPFNSDPYYVAVTTNEAFALDPVQYKQAVIEIFQLIKTLSPTTARVNNLFIAKNLDTLYPEGYSSSDDLKIVRTRMGENRGEFYFDVREGTNFSQRREALRVREARRQLEQQARLHARILERYEQLKNGMKAFEGRETEALAQMAGIKVAFPAPMVLLNPSSSKSAEPMMIHVTGKRGDFYDIDFPRKGRVQAETDLEEQWYVLYAANMTPYVPLVDGRAVPTYRVYSAGIPEACAQDHCADRVSFGVVLAKEFPNAGIDFSWTPDVSQQFVNAWQQASAQVEASSL